jgi:tetratricopeptide (TPR) repeat protein
MGKKIPLFLAALSVGMLCACTKTETTVSVGVKDSAQTTLSNSGFDTLWSTETQFIVESTLTDLAGMAWFANNGDPSALAKLVVNVTEVAPQGGTPLSYQVHIAYEAGPILDIRMKVDGAVWSPGMYADVANALFAKLALDTTKFTAGDSGSGHDYLGALTHPLPTVIEQENQTLSDDLRTHFLSPTRHEQAALLLAAFTLRDHSGQFIEIRSELCRMAAHLAFAQALRHGPANSPEGRLASAALQAFYGDQRAALRELDDVSADTPAKDAWEKTLRMRITGDYRLRVGNESLTLMEREEWFCSQANGTEAARADFLLAAEDELRGLTDWSRMLNARGAGVEIGHAIMDKSMRAEIKEIGEVYELSTGTRIEMGNFVDQLNVEPGPCITAAGAVRVIGWGHWAYFLQRHLCHAMVSDFDFLNRRWGVKDQATHYRQFIDKQFSGLLLFPFVRRQNATEEAYYHAAQDDEMKVVHHRPHLVPITLWNKICYVTDFCPLYIPPPHAFINEWHRFNPPPGATYQLHPRADHPSFANRPDRAEVLAKMHDMAPYDASVTRYYLAQQAGPDLLAMPPAEAMEKGYAPVLDYDVNIVARIAAGYRSDPKKYEFWALRAAALDPVWYYKLGDFYVSAGREAEAAEAYGKILPIDLDEVRMSNECDWLVKYWERHGERAQALTMATKAAKVYSSSGLRTLASLLEGRGDFAGAVENYQNEYERYGRPYSLIGCLLRHEIATGKTDYAPDLQELVKKTLPHGLRPQEMGTLKGPPASGVLYLKQSHETYKAGLKPGDIVVAIRGYKVENISEYQAVREIRPGAPFTLIIWRTDHYMEIKASPPDGLFGVEMGNYPKS